MSDAFFTVKRDLLFHPLWLDEPFTRGQAWVDIFGLAKWCKTHVRIRGVRVDLERGQLAMSEVEFAKRWKWSRGKVRRYLAELESKTVQQIVQQKTNVTTVVTVLKYNEHQRNGTADSTASDTASDTANGHIEEEEEVKNTKKAKKKTKAEMAREEHDAAIAATVLPENFQTPEFAEAWKNWTDMRRGKSPMVESTIKTALKKLSKVPGDAIEMLEYSTIGSYPGLFPVKKGFSNPQTDLPFENPTRDGR